MKEKVFISKPIVDDPLLDRISKPALIAWFRCNSCLSCKFREEVIDDHPTADIRWCSMTHQSYNIVDMVEFLGYKKQ